jgi:prevent-host-death family protein
VAQPDESTWSVAEAEARFGDAVARAVGRGPQTVTRRGERAVVVVSVEEWDRKTRRSGSLAEFFAASPLIGSGVEVERSDDPGRPVGV